MSFGWEPGGKLVGQDAFARLEPVDVLYELDSPMIFTFSKGEHLHLAYMCGETRGLSRFVIAPTNARVIASLRSGGISMRGALDQPWLWCVDVKPDGTVERCWITAQEDLPAKALPPHGIMLDGSLEPVFLVRVEGRSLGHDNVPASVIKRAVDGAYTALKKLSEAAGGGASAGRPGKTWKQFFDLPAQRVTMGSFEIAFREPAVEQERLPGMGGIGEQFSVLMQDFVGALSWAAQGDSSSETPRLQLLEAMENLVPPQHGLIEKVHVGGRIFGPANSTYVLDRDVTRKVRHALALARISHEEIKTIYGEAREFDKDKVSFRLHDQKSGMDYICFFQEDLYEDVLDAFSTDDMINVIVKLKKNTLTGEVIAIPKTAPNNEVEVPPATGV